MTTPGVLVAGRYRLHTRVASGGMGSVWEAEDEVLGRRVAVKILLPQPGTSPVDAAIARSRVIREARITARLHHPHAVTLFDVVEHAGQPCLIMQYVPSRSLNALLQERGVLPEQTVARIGAELASALTAAHLAGIVHRDVKPSNVLITHDGSAKLTDFGISHAAGDVNLTSTGMVSGTPAYLAPEVARGAPSGFPADVFSLGATLYAALEGAPPFGTEVNPMAILHRVASGTIIPPRRSGSLTPLLLHMLSPTAAYRPTMADVSTALAVAADGARPGADSERPTTSLPPPTVREWPPEPARSQPVRSEPVRSELIRPRGSLSDSLLGSGSLPDPPGSPAPIGRAATAAPRPSRSRRGAAIGAALAIALVALVALGVVLFSHRGGTTGVAGPTAPAAGPGGAVSSAAPTGSTPAPTRSGTARVAPLPASPLPTRSAADGPGSSSAPPRPATTATRPRTTASTPPSPTTRSSSSPSTSASTSTASTMSTTSSSASASSSATATAATGAPTAGQLAAAVTDYYAGLPAGTDNGWANLTPNFQTTIARNRQYYQSFWDGIESVSVSNARGTAPGTVDATITYRLKSGETSVELTRYRLVRSGGTLKIDSSTVVSSQ